LDFQKLAGMTTTRSSTIHYR